VLGDRIVLAAGCWTHHLGGLPSGAVPPIRPAKGQVLRLRSAVPFLRHVIRATSDGTAVYLVPRPDGELVVGATYEDRGYDTAVTAGGLWQLLARVRAALPQVGELELAEASAGLRPGSPDDLPILGETSVPDLLLASGHSHIGIQLAPVTADVMADLLVSGVLPEVARPFSPSRFAGVPIT
jgi:glycine oxidase